MSRRSIIRLSPALLAALLLAAGAARATCVTGTVITNAATICFHSGAPDFITYELPYAATATIQRLCTTVDIQKSVDRLYASSGATVTFNICIVNNKQQSAFNVVITDHVPILMMVPPGGILNWYNTTGAPAPGAPSVRYTTTGPTGGWTNGNPAGWVDGGGNTTYVSWTLGYVGPAKSACVRYLATVK